MPVQPVEDSSGIFDCKGTIDTSESLVAIGRYNGFDVVNPAASVRHLDPVETESDVLAVHWKSPTVVLAGARNGVVWLYDRRSRIGIMRLNHPSAVTAIRAPDEYRVTVAGMQDQVGLRSKSVGRNNKILTSSYISYIHTTFATAPLLSHPKQIDNFRQQPLTSVIPLTRTAVEMTSASIFRQPWA